MSLSLAALLQEPALSEPISIPEIAGPALNYSKGLVNTTEVETDRPKAGLPIGVFLNEGPMLLASVFSAKAKLAWTRAGLIAHVSVHAFRHRAQ